MNILIVSRDLSGGDMGYRLEKDGHKVKLFVEDKRQKNNFLGMVSRVTDWRAELGWVGKDGLIIFDHIGYGKIQEELRSKGYSVVGGCAEADKIEQDRSYGEKIFAEYGIKTVPLYHFETVKSAVSFLKSNPGPYVLKQDGFVHTSFNYVGQIEDNRDVVDVLKNYNKNNKRDCVSIILQKRIEGVEVGVARYFNGSDWVGPIEINLEHKDLFNKNLGPKTYEMGTVMWHDTNENNRLFVEVLAKLKPFLQKINFRGDIDVNCIVNQGEVFPLEPTARFGWPATHLHEEFNQESMAGLLKAVADGKTYNVKYKSGVGVVVLVATPPFPYLVHSKKYYPVGQSIHFRTDPDNEFLSHLHFEEVSQKHKQFYISSKTGFVLHVTAVADTVEDARELAYGRIGNIVIPKMFYRTDIGLKYINEDRAKLKHWGWV